MFTLPEIQLYGRITIPTITLVPIAPNTRHLVGQAWGDQYIRATLAIEKYVVPLEVCRGQDIHGALRHLIKTGNFKIKRVSLTVTIYIRPQTEPYHTYCLY